MKLCSVLAGSALSENMTLYETILRLKIDFYETVRCEMDVRHESGQEEGWDTCHREDGEYIMQVSTPPQ